MRFLVVWVGLAALLACSGTRPDEAADDTAAAVAGDVATSVEVEVGADSVRFLLHLTNQGSSPLVLEFNTAARYDFEVRTLAGSEVWRFSADQMFAQVLGTETVAPGDSRRYRASWAPAGRTGRFVVVGRIVATNRTIEQRAEFEIPTR